MSGDYWGYPGYYLRRAKGVCQMPAPVGPDLVTWILSGIATLIAGVTLGRINRTDQAAQVGAEFRGSTDARLTALERRCAAIEQEATGTHSRQ